MESFILIKNNIINVNNIVRIVFFENNNNIAIILNKEDDSINLHFEDNDDFEDNKNYIISKLSIDVVS